MKGFQLGRYVGGRHVTGRSVTTRINVSTTSSRMSIRHHSSAKQPLRASEWTPHSLTGSSSSDLGHGLLPRAPKDESTIHTAYIALGSNLGDRIDWIEKACNEMSARGIKLKRTSCLWETEPMYVIDQDSFINGACEVSHPDLEEARASC